MFVIRVYNLTFCTMLPAFGALFSLESKNRFSFRARPKREMGLDLRRSDQAIRQNRSEKSPRSFLNGASAFFYSGLFSSAGGWGCSGAVGAVGSSGRQTLWIGGISGSTGSP